MKKTLFRILRYWLFGAVIVTGLSGMLYAVVQQDLRLNANDPQIQIAEDTAAALSSGQAVQTLVPSTKVDIASSLAPYLIIFDATGKPIATSAQLNGQTPTIPSGVFGSVRQNGEDRFTWQPQVGVRSAVVVTQFKGANSGFVLAGRSLREVEIRESDIQLDVTAGWLAMLFATLVAAIVLFWKAPA